MRVLVTGASGFVGRELLLELAEHAEVFALGRTKPDAPFARWIEHDLVEPVHPAKLPDRVDAIVALAQADDHRAFPERAREIFAVNVRSTVDLLEYGRRAGARVFILASTGGLYGQSEQARETDPATASAPDASLRFYLHSKLSSEALVQGYSDILRTVILRPFFIYGPGASRMLIRTLAERVVAGETVTVVGDPGMRISPVYVRDVARAIHAALDSNVDGVVNLAGDERVTIRELVEQIASVAGVTPEIAARAGEAGALVGDNRRMREELGVETTPLAEGLRALLADVAGG